MRRAVRPLLFAAAVVAAACVEIATGPGGVASIRLVSVPPSIILGDDLRDSTGNVVTLRAVAFDAKGDTVKDAPFRFTALALPVDTTAAQRAVPLVVDSITGAVRALDTTVTPRARLAVRLGDRLQVVDTITLVKRPTQLAREATSDSVQRMAFFCNDTGRASAQIVSVRLSRADTGVRLGNALPLRVALTADSTPTRAPVRSYYVHYAIVSPANIPTVRRAGAPARPAISIIPDPTSDRTTDTDTTESTGIATAFLRVLPEGLPPTGAFAGDTIDVTVQATARTSPTALVPSMVQWVVHLRRLTAGLPLDTVQFRRDALTGPGCAR